MVLVFAESQSGKFKKAAFETVYYGYQTAQLLGTDCCALVLGEGEGIEALGNYGATKVYQVKAEQLSQFDNQVYAKVISEVFQKIGANTLILSHSARGKALLGRLAVRLNAGSVSGANALPTGDGSSLKVQKSVFSSKALAEFEITSTNKVISLMGNSLQPEVVGSPAEVVVLEMDVPAPRIVVKEVKTVDGEVPLTEAELVVSAGRGVKDPSNWGIIEELAKSLGAATACSRPVADTGWRPHHEHVGQTGVAIRPNLYIAIGISGAIQHLAGVNSSKVIVVINKDPEAPFFKAADYGVVGDLFDVVPRLTEAFNKFYSK